MATYADDTAIMAVGGDVEEATDKLQRAADEINSWTRQWLIKIKADKSTHVNFTNKRCPHIPIIMNGKPIPHSQTKLEGVCKGKTRGAWPKIQTHVLANGTTIGHVNT